MSKALNYFSLFVVLSIKSDATSPNPGAVVNSMSIFPKFRQIEGGHITINGSINVTCGSAVLLYLSQECGQSDVPLVVISGAGSIKCLDSPISKSCENKSTKCTSGTSGINTIYTNVTLLNISATYLHVKWVLTEGGIVYKAKLNVSVCPGNLTTYGPTILATSYKYNAPGQFVCPAGQELFYSNSTPGITNTTCQNDATWYGAEGLECWGAPNATLQGDLVGQAGQILHVECGYKKSIFPKAFEYNFQISGTGLNNTNKAGIFNFTLTPNMHGKKIQCQVITNYTQLRPDKGWSQQEMLNVTFKPFWTHDNHLICYTSCTIIFQSNPPPFYAQLHTSENRSVDVTKSLTQDGEFYKFIFDGKILEDNVEYTLEVKNSIGNANTNLTLLSTTTTQKTSTAKQTAMSTNQALVPIIAAGGSAVIIFVVGLLIALYLKHHRAKRDEKEERDNPLYGTSQGVVENTDALDGSKKNKKSKIKEVKVNVAYQSASNSPDAIEEAYGSVKTSEKEEKANILYEPAGPSTGPDETYAQVNKKNKKSKIKPMKVNVAYIPTPENPDAPEEAYAVVDKTKKIKDKKQKKGKQRNDTTDTPSQPGTSKTDEYAVVIKKVKNLDNKNGESSGGATYAVVSKTKKKKEPPPPPEPPSDSDDDPYAEVELHGQEDKGNI